MSFENRLLGNIDRSRENRSELSPLMERAYGKAREILRNPEYSIQEKDFIPVYGEDRVDSDLAKVHRLETSFNRDRSAKEINAKKIADVLEAIVLTQSEMSEWLGDATTLGSSRYDDYVNKVDMIAEWFSPQEGSRLLGLAVDVTFGLDAVQKKMRDMRAEVDAGRLGSIRYFRDERGDFMGTRNNVPRTVIGISQPVVQQLASLWIEGEKRQLGEHPIQRVFIDQIASQLRGMEQYALKKGQTGIAHAYRTALTAVEPVEAAKKHIAAGELSRDIVAEEIALQSAHLFKA
jgi:hypothetical protein